MFKLASSVLLFLLAQSTYTQDNPASKCNIEEACHNDDRGNTLVLISQKFPEVLCGGTIISPGYILTAAHCASRKPLYVYPGLASKNIATIKENEANGSRVVGQHLHPEFDRKTLKNDIAVFEVSPMLTLDSTYDGVVFQAWLPNSAIKGDPHEWENCTKDSYLMGWSSSLVSSTADVALCIRSPIIPLEDCKSTYPVIDLENRICVRKKPGGCLNHGGAVICNGQQVAVISYVHCNIGMLPCNITMIIPRSVTLVIVKNVLELLHPLIGDIVTTWIDRGFAYIGEALDARIRKMKRESEWWMFRFHIQIKIHEAARALFRALTGRAVDDPLLNTPYVSVRTDTAVGFINNFVNERAAAEGFHRLSKRLPIICALSVIIKFI